MTPFLGEAYLCLMTKTKPVVESQALVLGDEMLIDPLPWGDAVPDLSRIPSLGSYQ